MNRSQYAIIHILKTIHKPTTVKGHKLAAVIREVSHRSVFGVNSTLIGVGRIKAGAGFRRTQRRMPVLWC